IRARSDCGLRQEVVNAQPVILRTAQIQKAPGRAIEERDLTLRVQYNHAIRQPRRRALDLPHELDEALLVIALAPVQPHDLRDHLAPDAAEFRRIGKAAMAHPPVETEEIGELPEHA